MPVPFKEFQTLYPPHPALSWSPETLHAVRGYATQFKYDDWRVLIYVFPDGSIQFFSRKKHVLPIYRPPRFLVDELRALPLARKRFHVLDGGLLHYRGPRIRNTIVLWDILVHSNQYLVGKTYEQRYALLRKICGNPTEPMMLDQITVGWEVSPHLWLAPLLSGDPREILRQASRVPEIEGLVLKKLSAPLTRADRMEGNARWQIRVRKLAH